MGKVGCLLVCLAVLICTGYALNCYSCSSDKVEECKTESKSRKNITCAKAVTGYTPICFHKIELDKKTQKENATYGCENVKQDIKLDKESLPLCKATSVNHEVKDCGGCTEDLCNSTPVFSRKFVSFWWLPLMYCSVKVLWH